MEYKWFKEAIELITDVSLSTDTEIISDNLSELEGDMISFLYEDNIKGLLNLNFITIDQYHNAMNLRNKLLQIPSEKWNVDHFINDPLWEEIKSLAKKINPQ